MKKKNKKKMYKAWKRVKGRKGKWKTPLRSTQYASEMECKNRNCKMCNWKLGWTNAGIASDVSRRLFHYPLPRPSFLRGFLPTLRNGLRFPPSLFFSILSTIVEEDFTRKSSAWYTNDTIADAIIETLLFLIIWK